MTLDSIEIDEALGSIDGALNHACRIELEEKIPRVRRACSRSWLYYAIALEEWMKEHGVMTLPESEGNKIVARGIELELEAAHDDH